MHFIKKTFFKRFCAGTAAAALMFWTCGDIPADWGFGVFAAAEASSTGDFTVTGGTLNTDYTYADGVLTVNSATPLTISGTSITDRIEVASGVNANITLSGVNIDVSSTENAAAFMIDDDSSGNVTVTLVGENTLKSGENCAGLQKNGGTGTLTIKGTGSLTAEGGNKAAGIGGGVNGSGTGICITGGTIKAKGGSTRAWSEDGNSVSGDFGGAGIGGGLTGSGTVIIKGSAHVTAQGASGATGIGAGYCRSISNGARGTVTIEGGTVIATGGLTPGFSGSSGAGIGAGPSSHADVTITGGTVTATGGSSGRGRGSGGAGIGSSGGFGNATVRISGGTVIAKGGDDKNGGAGIGGGTSNYAVNVTISGGTVTATGGSNVSSDGSGGPGAGIGLNAGGGGNVIFSTTGDSSEGNAFIIATGGTGSITVDGITNGVSSAGNGLIVNGETTVWGVDSYTLSQTAELPGGVTLTIPNGKTLTVNSTLTNNGTLRIDGGTLNGTGTLSGSGSFVTTTLTEDMITIPTDLVYNGSDLIKAITEQTKAVTTICGREFGVTGWSLSVTKNSDLEYTVTYTNGGNTVSKTVTVGQSETGIEVTTYKDNTETTEFTYGDTITVKADIQPTGMPVAAKATRLRGVPTALQAAVYYGDEQITDPVTVTDGKAEFSVPTAYIGAGEKTFTVKFTGNDNMADKSADFTVNIEKLPIEVIAVTGLEDKIYDGTTDASSSSPVTLNIDDMGLPLVCGISIEYTSPDAGTNTVYVTLYDLDADSQNNYTLSEGGRYTVTADKAILKANPTADMFTFTPPENNVYTGSKILPTIEPNADIKDMGEATIKCDGINAGTHTATISVAEGKNYNAAELGYDTWTFDIAPVPLSSVAAELSETAFVYDKESHKPTVTLTYNSMTLTEGTDYEIEYPNDTVSKGEKTIKLTGKGNYTGELEVTYSISSGIYDPVLPEGLTAVYGDTLADVAFPVAPDGTWTWQDSAMSVGSAGTNSFAAVFTPSNENFAPVTKNVAITVEKADPSIAKPTAASAVYREGITLAEINLPSGWTWADSTISIISNADGQTFKAQYIPADTVNYNTIFADVTLTFTPCMHTETTVNTVQPNCTADGYKETVCNYCHVVVNREILPATDHTEDSGKVTLKPTYESEGVRTYYCTACGIELRTETIPVLAPEHTHSFGTAWSCDSTSHWHECSCGETSDFAFHTEDLGTVTVQPTVESEGTKVFNCAVCGFKLREEIIPKLDYEHTHSFGTEWFSDSMGHWHVCSCGETGDFASHTEDLGTITVYPTETAEGTKIFKCTACGYVTKTETIPPTGFRPNPTPTPMPPPTPSAPVIPTTVTTKTETEKVPYIEGSNGKSGWEAIYEEISEARKGGTVTVDMNGTTLFPKDIAKEIAGKDIDLVLDMGGGISWTINGLGVSDPKAVDMSVSKNTKNIPVDVINNVSGESFTMQISLSHNGAFGFTAALNIDLGKKNNGLYANLFYYNSGIDELEFVDCSIIENGKASIEFTHASDYAIVIDSEPLGAYEDISVAAGLFSEGDALDESKTVYPVCGAVVLIIAGIPAVIFVRRRQK